MQSLAVLEDTSTFYFYNVPENVASKNVAFIFESKDLYDNSSSDTSQIFEIIDIIDPEVVITYPTEDIIVPEYENFTIDWQQSDNIGIASHLFEYSANGVDYDTLLLNTDEYQQLSQSFSLNGVTATGRVKLTVNDLEGNSSTDYSAQIIVQDNTPPEVTLSSSFNDSIVYIAEVIQLSWASSDNVASEHVKIDYRPNNQAWISIVENEPDVGLYDWFVPNDPTDNLQLRIIAFDGVGLSDTSIVENMQILISYPIVENILPSMGTLNWNEKEVILSLSQALDTNTVSVDNITISSLTGLQEEPIISYIDSTNSISLLFEQGVVTNDSIFISISDNVTNIYGYRLDGDMNGDGGGDYIASYATQMLADYNDDKTISVEDLSQFVVGLDTDDYSYELGPFNGEIPNVFVDVDNNYNIEDVVGFAMMWNWYFANNPSSFQSLADEGSISNIEMAHDSIFIDIPNGLSAYQVQISYEPGNVVINNSKKDNESELFLTKRSSEHGVYTIMATPNSRKIAIPIQIIGKNAQVSVSYKGMDTNGELHGQMTRSKNIENLPDDFVLYANYPNPFNPQTRIDFGLPVTGHVNLKIYDIMGREVVTLLNETISAGYKSILWNATNKSGQPVSAGMYFYALQVKDFMQIKKMVLLK